MEAFMKDENNKKNQETQIPQAVPFFESDETRDQDKAPPDIVIEN
jgi:hypothetical protein